MLFGRTKFNHCLSVTQVDFDGVVPSANKTRRVALRETTAKVKRALSQRGLAHSCPPGDIKGSDNKNNTRLL